MLPNEPKDREIVETAFALGGLAGHNYHGLGFLQAALEKNVVPGMISCTSGQIYWTWNYLLAKNQQLHSRQGANDLADLARKSLTSGKKPGPAVVELAQDIPAVAGDILSKWGDFPRAMTNPVGYFLNLFLNTFPERICTPALESKDYEQIACDFNEEAEIGIIFNTYNPIDGIEYVHLNARAQGLLRRAPHQSSSFRLAQHHRTEYEPITADAVKNALWIYEYGFKNQTFLDGAYFRQVILSELSRARTIFVARPGRTTWVGNLPKTYGDKEDLKTEIFFNATYYGERFRINLINRLIDSDAFTDTYKAREGYHKITIKEIPFRLQKGFVGYTTEDMEMFDQARDEALRML